MHGSLRPASVRHVSAGGRKREEKVLVFAVPGLCAQHLARSLSARLYTATMPTSDEVVVLGGKRKRKKGAEAGLKR
eukprot:SAG25_NODE_10201_length_343_cov_0.627049_1_plen_75_part_10